MCRANAVLRSSPWPDTSIPGFWVPSYHGLPGSSEERSESGCPGPESVDNMCADSKPAPPLAPQFPSSKVTMRNASPRLEFHTFVWGVRAPGHEPGDRSREACAQLTRSLRTVCGRHPAQLLIKRLLSTAYAQLMIRVWVLILLRMCRFRVASHLSSDGFCTALGARDPLLAVPHRPYADMVVMKMMMMMLSLIHI